MSHWSPSSGGPRRRRLGSREACGEGSSAASGSHRWQFCLRSQITAVRWSYCEAIRFPKTKRPAKPQEGCSLDQTHSLENNEKLPSKCTKPLGETQAVKPRHAVFPAPRNAPGRNPAVRPYENYKRSCEGCDGPGNGGKGKQRQSGGRKQEQELARGRACPAQGSSFAFQRACPPGSGKLATP